jgi:hypothetical protein
MVDGRGEVALKQFDARRNIPEGGCSATVGWTSAESVAPTPGSSLPRQATAESALRSAVWSLASESGSMPFGDDMVRCVGSAERPTVRKIGFLEDRSG